MENYSFTQAINSVKAFQQEFRSSKRPGIVKDRTLIEYSDNSYKLTFTLIQSDGKGISMEWPIDTWFSIPSDLRDLVKKYKRVLLDEYEW